MLTGRGSESSLILKPHQGNLKTWKEADSIPKEGSSVGPCAYATSLCAHPNHGDRTRKLRSGNIICMDHGSLAIVND